MADLLLDANPHFKKKGLPDSIRLSNLQNLLQDSLLSTGHVEKAALISRTDAKVTAATVGFNIDGQKAAMFIDAFKSPQITRQRGLTYNDTEYECVRSDSRSIYAKNGKSGFILVQTETLVLIANYNENMYASVAVEAVEKLGDYLREKGK